MRRKDATNTYFRQAHDWEVCSPILDDLHLLPGVLQMVMIWMQQRIRVYETKYPDLREQYGTDRGLSR